MDYSGKMSASFFHGGQRDVPALNHFLGDFKFLDALLAGQVIHEVKHELFQNHTQSACADFAQHGFTRDGGEGPFREAQLYAFKFEHALVLLDDGVAWTGEDFDKGGFVQVIEDADDRKTADK